MAISIRVPCWGSAIDKQPMESDPIDIPDPSTHAADEEAILNSPEGPLDWMKSTISPLLSASANLAASADIDVFLEQHFDDLPVLSARTPEGPLTDCAFPKCKRQIGPSSSRFHCPQCTKTFCSSHAGHPSFEVAVTNNDGPTRKKFMRICLMCWSSRPENQTGLGADRSWMNKFRHVREESVNKKTTQRTTLEARLNEVPKSLSLFILIFS